MHALVSTVITAPWRVCVHTRLPRAQVVPEAERRAYTYRGVCVGRANKGPRSWVKLYNVFPDAGGFVQHFPM